MGEMVAVTIYSVVVQRNADHSGCAVVLAADAAGFNSSKWLWRYLGALGTEVSPPVSVPSANGGELLLLGEQNCLWD